MVVLRNFETTKLKVTSNRSLVHSPLVSDSDYNYGVGYFLRSIMLFYMTRIIQLINQPYELCETYFD